VASVDKKKTGKLIKEARIQKNYTQGELGTLVGVSNKAVSRWENGDSFPDVGVLENLASILGVSIQDIIMGEIEGKEDSAVTAIVRVASLQQREKRRAFVTNILLIIVLIFCGISGYSAMGRKGYVLVNDSIISYIVLMTISDLLIFFIWRSEENITNHSKFERSMKIVALLLLALTIAIGFGSFFMLSNDSNPFRMEKTELGPFINGQFIGVFIVNFIFLFLQYVCLKKKVSSIHSGWLLSVTSMYLLVLYGDLLHRVDSFQGLIESFLLRSFMVTIIPAVLSIVACVDNNRRKKLSRSE
jgi:transcriptional regulator with XRE-family HTH domain